MYIQNKPLSAIWKLLIGAISLILEWYLLSQYGVTALRLFPTWVLFIAAIYFLSSALILALSNSKFSGKSLCPMSNGTLIIAFVLMSGVTLASLVYQFYLPSLDSWVVWLISLVLPVFVLLDWLLFIEKGSWKIMMPFYGLALPVLYVAMMIFTAEILPETTNLLYPLEVFDLRQFGVWPAIYYLGATAALVLIFGYILYIVDFAMSGRLSKYIVLPHLKVVDVDEDGNEIPTELTESGHASNDQPEPRHQPKTEPEIEVSTKTTGLPEAELESAELDLDAHDATKSTNTASSSDLSDEEKQTINDLGEVLSEAIQAEISKQEKTEAHESHPKSETIKTSKVEITKIVVLEDEEVSSDKPQNPPKSHQISRPKKPLHQKPKSTTPPKSQKKPQYQPKPQAQTKSPKKSSKPPKITRY